MTGWMYESLVAELARLEEEMVVVIAHRDDVARLRSSWLPFVRVHEDTLGVVEPGRVVVINPAARGCGRARPTSCACMRQGGRVSGRWWCS